MFSRLGARQYEPNHYWEMRRGGFAVCGSAAEVRTDRTYGSMYDSGVGGGSTG